VRGLKTILRGAALAAGLWASMASAETLRVLAWDGYADPDWVKEFTKDTGIDVSVVFIGSDDEIWAKIKGSEGKDFDVMAVNTAQLQRYIDANLVTPWDLSNIPNQKEVLPRFRDLAAIKGETRDGKVYGIPFCFDSIG
jgi:putative spermidine/putrescine transport system substrate-binding protein